MANVGNATDGHAHGDRNQGVQRSEAAVHHFDVGVFGEENVIRAREPRLRAAGQSETHVLNFHAYALPVRQGLLDLIEALMSMTPPVDPAVPTTALGKPLRMLPMSNTISTTVRRALSKN